MVDLGQPLCPPEPPHARRAQDDLVPVVLAVRRHGVVQVQHEERGGGGGAQRGVGPGASGQTQDGQDLLLHLLLLAAAEPPEAGVDHGLGLLAPQGEQEEQGEEEQGPAVEEEAAPDARVLPLHSGAAAGAAAGGVGGHDRGFSSGTKTRFRFDSSCDPGWSLHESTLSSGCFCLDLLLMCLEERFWTGRVYSL